MNNMSHLVNLWPYLEPQKHRTVGRIAILIRMQSIAFEFSFNRILHYK